MLQEGGIYPSARVADTVRHYCALYDRGADAGELVELVGLAERATATWRRLSGGERQRLSLALALAARPDVAFLDEPTSGVDVHGRDTIRGVVRDARRPRAAPWCSRRTSSTRPSGSPTACVIFDHGRVVADGTLAELRSGRERIRFRSAPGLDIDGARRPHSASPVAAIGRRRVHDRVRHRNRLLMSRLADLAAGARRIR